MPGQPAAWYYSNQTSLEIFLGVNNVRIISDTEKSGTTNQQRLTVIGELVDAQMNAGVLSTTFVVPIALTNSNVLALLSNISNRLVANQLNQARWLASESREVDAIDSLAEEWLNSAKNEMISMANGSINLPVQRMWPKRSPIRINVPPRGGQPFDTTGIIT